MALGQKVCDSVLVKNGELQLVTGRCQHKAMVEFNIGVIPYRMLDFHLWQH